MRDIKRIHRTAYMAVVWCAMSGGSLATAQTSLTGSSLVLKSASSATLSSSGYVGTYLTVPAGGATVNFTVNATEGSGTTAPQLNLSIADSNFGFNIDSSSATNYTTSNVTLPAGTYEISAQRDYDGNTSSTTPFTVNNLAINTVSGSAVTFANSSTDANALAAANTYIDNFRKGDATVAITGPSNILLLAGTPVNARLGKLAFDFGGAVSGSNISDPKDFTAPNPAAGSDIAKIQAFMNSNFSIIVPSNAGKWVNNEATQNNVTMQLVDEQLAYAQAHNMDARMHNLIWGTQQPIWVNSLISSATSGNATAKANLSTAISNRINYYVGTNGDRSDKYINVDVLNEPLNNPSYYNIYGASGIANIYNQVAAAAAAAGSTALAFTNEYNVLQFSPASISSSGAESGSDQYANWYRNYVESIRNAGGAVGGIGVEYYVNPNSTGTNAPSAATMEKAIQNLAIEGLPISMNEFGMNSTTGSQTLGPQDMQDAMTMFFGTPEATEFLIWGWADLSTNATPPAALLNNKNGESLTAMGTRWEYMFSSSVTDSLKGGTNPDPWTTNVQTTVDSTGSISFNGFYGDYYLNGETSGNYDMNFVKGTNGYSVNLAAPPTWSIWKTGSTGDWGTSANWSTGGVANSSGQTAYFGAASSATTIALDNPQTVGMIAFDSSNSYLLIGNSTLTLQGFNVAGGHVAQIEVVSGSHTINNPLQLLDNTTINVMQSASTLTIANLRSSNVTLTKTGSGTLLIGGIQTAGLAVNGGLVKLAPNVAPSSIASLSVASGATLDMNNDAMSVSYTTGNNPIDSITDRVSAGYDQGKWDQPGIISSAAASMAATALAINDNGSSVVISYTWIGDANGDGMVTSADLSLMSVTGTSWQTGDFNYDRVVNADDFALFALGTAVSHGESINSVPEPCLDLLAGALGFGFVRRRKEGFFP